ncbi:MAG: T9SS type A sorting domain-containing protein [Ignavibacteriales bacterium]|nr:T9SS type A sorting domain-containing protein [Ignavibacteriales bacterium]
MHNCSIQKSKKIGDVIRISEHYNSWNSQPHVIFNEHTKEYVVTWADDGTNIKIQRVSEFGLKIGANTTINDQYILNTNNPSLAVDPHGNMMATWTSDGLYFGINPIFCRVLDREGKPKGSSFHIMNYPTDDVSSYGWEKRIASDSLGRFLIVWSSYVDGYGKIVVQAVDSNGTLIGTNTIISDPVDSSLHYFPTVTGLRGGQFLVVWEKQTASLSGRVYSIDSGILSPQLNLSNKRDGWFTTGISSNQVDKFVVTYSGWTYAERANGILILGANGEILDSAHTLPEPYFSSVWSHPNPSMVQNNSFVIAYSGNRKAESDAVAQKILLPNTLQGSVLKMGNDECSSNQQNPATAINKFGESIVVWEDNKTSYPSLVAQIYDAQQQPIGSNFFVSDVSTFPWATDAFVIADKDGNFVVSFSGGEYSYRDLVAQKVSRAGNLIGSNKNITKQPYSYSRYKSTVRQMEDGNYIVIWFGASTMYSQCFFQILNRDLTVSSEKKPLLVSSEHSIKWMFDVAMNENTDIAVLWTDANTQYVDHAGSMKAIIFDKEGKSVSDTIVVNVLQDSKWYMSAACALDEQRNLFVAFSDMSYFTYDPKMTFTRLYSNASVKKEISVDIIGVRPIFNIAEFTNSRSLVAWHVSGNIRALFFDDVVNIIEPIQLYTYATVYPAWSDVYPNFSATISGDMLFLAYVDVVDQERGYDVFANYQSIAGIDFSFGFIQDNNSPEQITSAFPNPNKSIATIAYTLKIPTNVEIAVYNILGQKMATIVNKYHSTGTFYATFDTRTIPSGVYFFHYQGIKSHIQKFIVTK